MAHDHASHRGHHHPHGHNHHHAHGSAGASGGYGRAFAVGITLNVVFVVVEVIYGVASGSIALVSDAAHNLGDVLGLALAWAALLLAKRKPSRRRTYGFRKTTVLAALVNAVLLLVAVGGVAWEALGRLRNPVAIDAPVVMAVASVGVLINGVSAMFFFRGSSEDANVKGAFLHLASDAAVSLGVVISAFVILRTGWTWLDPAVSLLVSMVILFGTWSLLKQSVNLALDAVPDNIDPQAVESYLASLPGVVEVHDLHIWAMSTTETAMTAHLIMPNEACQATFLRDVGKALHDRFLIEHSTLQVEPPEAPDRCRLAPEEAL